MAEMTKADVERAVNSILQSNGLIGLAGRFSLEHNSNRGTHKTDVLRDIYEPGLVAGASTQYYRGDKSWATLNQAAVAGLTVTDGPTFDHVHAKVDIVDPAAGTPVAVTAAQCQGSIITNANAAADVEYDLPAAVKGMKVTFFVETAHKMKLDPNGTDQIMVLTDAAGNFLESDAVAGSYITLVCLVAGKWYKTDFVGVWTEE